MKHPSDDIPADPVMHEFLATHRDELIRRCRAKASLRPQRLAAKVPIDSGVPLFLDQLTRTLVAERSGDLALGLAISGASGGDARNMSELGIGAAAHGAELLGLGLTIDQVVHDYGDLCQSITDLAFERKVAFTVDEFRTLNRCLDNAIADAVTSFSAPREPARDDRRLLESTRTLGVLVHELRNALQIASLAVRAMEQGGLTLAGATGTVLKRSLATMRDLVRASVDEVRASVAASPSRPGLSVASLVEDATASARLEADARGCQLAVPPVDPLLRVEASRELLLGALANLLGNALKFSHPRSQVSLSVGAADGRVVIDVEDRCGGLPAGFAETLFLPFQQLGNDRSGLGLGLSIARHIVELCGGSLTVRNVPGTGCVFSIVLPNVLAAAPA